MKSVFKDTDEQKLLLDFFKDKSNGIYIDVGGNIPENSVSSVFHSLGWSGLIIEPIPLNVDRFIKEGRTNIWQGAVTSPVKAQNGCAIFHLAGGENGPHSSLDESSISFSSKITTTISVALSTVNILAKNNNIYHIDLLSIDTEGTEVDVLLGTDLKKLSPKLILVEDWARDFSIHKYLISQNYKLVRRTGFNSWYIDKSDIFHISIFGYMQLFKKYILGMPGRKLRHWRHKKKA
jgi:FkbM family methyltransferase